MVSSLRASAVIAVCDPCRAWMRRYYCPGERWFWPVLAAASVKVHLSKEEPCW
ncbi:MAG: hypothetical protein QME71_06875 [Dehalococcoidia bacterium]|nr:hypothetical protein [Dehalococcoidia bacterium]